MPVTLYWGIKIPLFHLDVVFSRWQRSKPVKSHWLSFTLPIFWAPRILLSATYSEPGTNCGLVFRYLKSLGEKELYLCEGTFCRIIMMSFSWYQEVLPEALTSTRAIINVSAILKQETFIQWGLTSPWNKKWHTCFKTARCIWTVCVLVPDYERLIMAGPARQRSGILSYILTLRRGDQMN